MDEPETHSIPRVAPSLKTPLQLSMGRLSVHRRIKFFITGVILPCICCVMASCRKGMAAVDTPWQSGKVTDYVAMLLQWPGLAPFLPLVSFGAISLAIWCIRPETSKYFSIRLGIYSGTLVSTQFLLLVMVTTTFVSCFAALFAAGILAAVVFGIDKLLKRSKRFQIWHILVLTSIVACLIVVMKALDFSALAILFAVPFLFILATPTLTPITFVRASIHIAEQQPTVVAPKRWPFFVVTWIAAWLLSWRWAVHIMLDEYAKLPTTNPNCYISSAAANGHRRLVGSHAEPGNGIIVNDQMRRLKFLELALRATSPMLHRPLRQLYDRIGPALASQCSRSIWLADLSYLVLKPGEWIAVAVQLAARVDDSLIAKLYGQTRR